MCRWRRSPRQQWRFSPDRKSKRLTSVNTTTSMVSTPTTIYTLSLHDALPIFFGRRKLRWAQRYHFLSGWLPWISDGLGLIVTIFALVWTLLMILAPRHFDVPMAALSAAAVALFARSEEQTPDLSQHNNLDGLHTHHNLYSFPTRRSSDLLRATEAPLGAALSLPERMVALDFGRAGSHRYHICTCLDSADDTCTSTFRCADGGALRGSSGAFRQIGRANA